MIGIDFKVLLGKHVVRCLLLIGEGLSSVDLLHMSGVTILRGENECWLFNKSVGNSDLFNLFS